MTDEKMSPLRARMMEDMGCKAHGGGCLGHFQSFFC